MSYSGATFNEFLDILGSQSDIFLIDIVVEIQINGKQLVYIIKIMYLIFTLLWKTTWL